MTALRPSGGLRAGLTAGLLLLAAPPLAAQQEGEGRPPVRVEDRADMDPEIAALLAERVAAVEAAPADAEAHAGLGLAYEANTLFVAAAESYRNAIALSDAPDQWVYRLAVVLTRAGHPDALPTMERAGEAFKNTPVVQARLGQLRFRAGDLDGSSAAWEQAIAAEERQPTQIYWPESRVGLAQVRMAQGRYEEAEGLLRSAIARDQAYRHAHFLLGECLMELGQYEEGELELKRGVEAWPRFPGDPHQPRLDEYAVGFHRRMMGIENMMQAGRMPDAVAALQEILARQPDNHFALNLLGRAQMRMGDSDGGLATLRKSEAANPGSVTTKIELAIALMNVLQQRPPQDPAEAQAMMEEILAKTTEAVQAAPKLGRSHFYRGLALRMTLNPQQPDPNVLNQVLGEMSMALTLGCQEPMLLQQLATLYAQMGRQREMLDFARANLDERPDDPAAHEFLVRALFTAAQPQTGAQRAATLQEALRVVEHAAQHFPGIPQMAQFAEQVRQAVAAENPDKQVP